MARRKIDKAALASLIRESKELSNDQKSDLLQLLNEQKRYGLVWEQHKEDAEELLEENIPVLVEEASKRILSPSPEGEGWGGAPNHILIEGDNLHALTALTYTHEGKVDVIYIDPPYNTGHKDFAYNDNYVDADDGFRHSKWLSFMDKRLRIAKKLMSQDSVIFLSIDDNEISDLRLLCDDIFGAKNFVACVVQKSRDSISGDLLFSPNHNYLLVYAKTFELLFSRREVFRIPTLVDETKFKNPDNDPRGPWKLSPVDGPGGAKKGNPFYEFLGVEMYFRYSKEMMQKYYDDGLIVKRKTSLGKKYFLSQALAKNGEPPTTWWDDAGTTTVGTKLLKEIIPDTIFTNPKPIELIVRCLQLASSKNSLILDFFAGSGTTLHATMQLNAEDGGHRQCILVTNNENNICEEVTYERNKRVINGYTTPKGVEVPGLTNNNLRYYKTAFVPRENTHQSLKEQAYTMTDLLCIKEGIYTEQTEFGGLSLKGKSKMVRYFAENDTSTAQGKKMLIIYDSRVIPYIVGEIAKMDEEGLNIKVYVFADGSYPYSADFEDVLNKVTLIAMPYAMNQSLRHVLPAKQEIELEGEPETEEE